MTSALNGTKCGTKIYSCLQLVENSSRTNQERTTPLSIWWAGGDVLVCVAGRTLHPLTSLNLFKSWNTDKKAGNVSIMPFIERFWSDTFSPSLLWAGLMQRESSLMGTFLGISSGGRKLSRDLCSVSTLLAMLPHVQYWNFPAARPMKQRCEVFPELPGLLCAHPGPCPGQHGSGELC